MKKIIFFSTPAYGHVMSVYPIIKELVNKGYQVDWYGSRRFMDLANGCGAHFIEYPDDFEVNYNLAEMIRDFFQLMKSLMRLNRRCYEIYNLGIDWDEVDLILYDSMCSFGKNLGYAKGIVHICLCTTLAYNWRLLLCSNMGLASLRLGIRYWKEGLTLLKEERNFRKKFHLPRFRLVDFFVNAGDETLVMSPLEFQPFVKSFDSSFHFVGTTIKDRLLSVKKVYPDYDVYISFGSIMTENQEFINQLLPMFHQEKTMVTIGHLNIKSPRDNIHLEAFTEQLGLLPKVQFFINHGGLNSVYEALYLGIPQVSIPQNEETKLTALRLEELGLGLCIEEVQGLDWQGLQMKLTAMKKTVEGFSKVLQSYDGTALSLEIIEGILERK